MQPNRLRSIAPKDSQDEAELQSAALQAHGSSHSLSRKVKGHIACEGCRRGKKKCDGKRPTCSNCRGNPSDCVYPTPAREAVREVKELEDHLALVKALLFSTADTSDPAAVMAIIAKLRQNEAGGISMSSSEIGTLLSGQLGVLPDRSSLLPVRAREILYSGLAEGSDTKNLKLSMTSNIAWAGELGPGSIQSSSQQADSMSTETDVSSAAMSPNEDERATRSVSTASTSTFGNLSFASAIFANHHTRALQNTQEQSLHLPSWQVLPLNLEDYYFVNLDLSRAVSAAVVSYRNKARLYLAYGGDQRSIFFSRIDPSFLQIASDNLPDHSIATWAIRWVRAFEELVIMPLPFRMAIVYLSMLQMKWQLDPTPTTYAAMPEWLRPTTSQKFVPHFSLIDFIVWPQIREALVTAPNHHDTVLVKYMSFSWPFSDDDVFGVEEQSGERDLSERFKSYTTDLSNWTLNPDVRKELPYLAASV